MTRDLRGRTTGRGQYHANLPPGVVVQVFPLTPKGTDIFEIPQICSSTRRGRYQPPTSDEAPSYSHRGEISVGH